MTGCLARKEYVQAADYALLIDDAEPGPSEVEQRGPDQLRYEDTFFAAAETLLES